MVKVFAPLDSNLRVEMAKKKLSKVGLSGLSGVSRHTISLLLDEIPASTKMETLMKLAEPLGVEWLDLIDRSASSMKGES